MTTLLMLNLSNSYTPDQTRWNAMDTFQYSSLGNLNPKCSL